jgi:hypothetical protein
MEHGCYELAIVYGTTVINISLKFLTGRELNQNQTVWMRANADVIIHPRQSSGRSRS